MDGVVAAVEGLELEVMVVGMLDQGHRRVCLAAVVVVVVVVEVDQVEGEDEEVPGGVVLEEVAVHDDVDWKERALSRSHDDTSILTVMG